MASHAHIGGLSKGFEVGVRVLLEPPIRRKKQKTRHKPVTERQGDSCTWRRQRSRRQEAVAQSHGREDGRPMVSGSNKGCVAQ